MAIRRASGGDINDAYLITLADGRRLFVKTNRAAPPMMFEREAEGLELLRTAAGTHLAVPEVLALGSRFLILQCLEVTPASAAQEARLGRGLAEMHRAEAPRPRCPLACEGLVVGRSPRFPSCPPRKWAPLLRDKM